MHIGCLFLYIIQALSVDEARKASVQKLLSYLDTLEVCF